ncbi:MAG TPA: glycosyltransferase family 39 protein [Vicinamibacterales bacterium]|nr:glycosyltransferase family 39 protein [Vicinamibacterales bacterium]
MTIIPLPSLVEVTLSIIFGLVLLLGVGWLVRAFGLELPTSIERVLSGRVVPVVAGIISGAIVLFVWRSANEPGTSHDEQAYLLQAEILARGHWTGEPPPMPEFFEQPHVLVEPRLAAKYPPGNSLALIPGIWAGWPGLVPIIMSGVAGALIFTVVRQLTNSSVALLTWVLWSTSTTSLYWRATYYSQNTTAVLWLVAILGLMRWGSSRRWLPLAVVGCSFGFMYLTRPLTAFALGLPAGVLIVMMAWKRNLWQQVLVTVAVVIPILAFELLWRHETMGDWRTHPYQEYSRQYLPFDRPGFGVDLTPAAKPRGPALQWIEERFSAEHARHQLSSLPAILAGRVIVLIRALAEGWRIILVLGAAVGVVLLRGPGWFGVISAAALVLGYLAYAHAAWWNVYYTEIFAVFFFIAALGLISLARIGLKLDEPTLKVTTIVALMVLTPWLASDVVRARRRADDRGDFHRRAREAVAAVAGTPSVVFVSYPPRHAYFRSLVVNSPDYRTARVWLVYDRGGENERLLRVTARPAYRLRTDTWALERIR